jgi:hypothetical protein
MKNKAKTKSKTRAQRRARSERLKSEKLAQHQSRMVLHENNQSESAEVVYEKIQPGKFIIDSLALLHKMMEDEQYMKLHSEQAFVEVEEDELQTALYYTCDRQFDVLSARRHAHQKILLGKWLKYGLFYNLAWFSFRDLGKPSQGVSPPFDETLQAA